MQPCGGTLADFRETDGDRLAFRVDAGNVFVTDAYFPFYRVQLERYACCPAPLTRGNDET
jgi:hypothetical protein